MQDLKPILLLEDDKVDAMTVKRALKRLNIANPVVNCIDGEKAVEYLNQQQGNDPCLILTDVNLPGMSGIEFLNTIKKDKRFNSIPAFVFSISPDGSDISDQIKYNVTGFITKPFEPDEFEQKLKQAGLENLLTVQSVT